MADSLLGGLDPDALKGLLAALQPLQQALGPSAEDKDAARSRAIAQAGLAMMGARKGQEFDAIGRAGLLGLQGYNQDLQQIGQQRQQSMGLLSGLMPLLQRSNLPGQVWGEGGQQPASAPAPGAVGGNGMGGGTPALFGPSSQPGQVTAPDANAKAAALSLGKQLVNLGYSPQLINGVLTSSKEPMKDLMDLYKEGVKIHTGAGNIPMQRNPQTGQIDAMPAAGYNDALAAQTRAQTGAQEEAKQPYTLQNLNLPGGGTQQVFGDQVQKILRGDKGAPASAGLAGSFGQSPSPSQQSQDTEIAKVQGKEYTDLVSAERMAPSNIGKFQLMKSYLGNVNTGKAAPSVLSLKAYASYFAPELAKGWSKDVPYAQAASALSNELALQLRNPAGGAGMPGSLSNSDRDFLTSMTASAANDPRAIPLMLDARIAMEKRSQEIGKMARDYRAKTGKIDEGFYQQIQDYAEGHPLFHKQGDQPGAVSGDAPQIKRTGTYNGKKVVEYADGRVEYVK